MVVAEMVPVKGPLPIKGGSTVKVPWICDPALVKERLMVDMTSYVVL